MTPASSAPAAQARIAEIAARLKAATPVETAEHPYRPHTALSERIALTGQIKRLGRVSIVQTLRIYAIHNPPQGSFAGSLWALSEQVDALITEADQGRADIAHLLSEVARLEALVAAQAPAMIDLLEGKQAGLIADQEMKIARLEAVIAELQQRLADQHPTEEIS